MLVRRGHPAPRAARLEHERMRPVAPGLRHLVAEPAALQLGEALLGDGRAAEITAHALDPLAVATV